MTKTEAVETSISALMLALVALGERVVERLSPAGSEERTLAQSSARGLSRDYPMMNTATIADSRGASVSRKKAIPSSIAASTPSAAVSLNSS